MLQGRISLYVLMISLGIMDLKFLILNKVVDECNDTYNKFDQTKDAITEKI